MLYWSAKKTKLLCGAIHTCSLILTIATVIKPQIFSRAEWVYNLFLVIEIIITVTFATSYGYIFFKVRKNQRQHQQMMKILSKNQQKSNERQNKDNFSKFIPIGIILLSFTIFVTVPITLNSILLKVLDNYSLSLQNFLYFLMYVNTLTDALAYMLLNRDIRKEIQQIGSN